MEILKDKYWSKSQAFLLPLTGLSKTLKYPVESFLFWEEYSIEKYQLILKFKYPNYKEFLKFCKDYIFPTLSENGAAITDAFDGNGETVFIVDISEWALDVQMFLKGKYSKFSKDARDTIDEYHKYFDGRIKLPDEIHAALDPTSKYKVYGNMSAIEYVAQEYGFDLDTLTKVGELADPYNKKEETLTGFTAKVAHK